MLNMSLGRDQTDLCPSQFGHKLWVLSTILYHENSQIGDVECAHHNAEHADDRSWPIWLCCASALHGGLLPTMSWTEHILVTLVNVKLHDHVDLLVLDHDNDHMFVFCHKNTLLLSCSQCDMCLARLGHKHVVLTSTRVQHHNKNNEHACCLNTYPSTLAVMQNYEPCNMFTVR